MSCCIITLGLTLPKQESTQKFDMSKPSVILECEARSIEVRSHTYTFIFQKEDILVGINIHIRGVWGSSNQITKHERQ